MGKLNCSCGSQLSDVADPSHSKGWLLRDIDLEIEDVDPIVDGVDVWECHNCGRLAVGNNDDRKVKWYLPENGEVGHITD